MHTVHHDTKAWKTQVWASFATAATLCGSGLAWLPGRCRSSVSRSALSGRPSPKVLGKKTFIAAVMLALALAGTGSAQARSDASEVSALSMLPIAVSVAAPVALLSAGAALTVVAVSTVAEGTVWVLERASDGARASITVSGQVAGGVSVIAGTAVVATAISTGWVLSAAGAAICFIPNEIGKALLYNERVTR